MFCHGFVTRAAEKRAGRDVQRHRFGHVVGHEQEQGVVDDLLVDLLERLVLRLRVEGRARLLQQRVHAGVLVEAPVGAVGRHQLRIEMADEGRERVLDEVAEVEPVGALGQVRFRAGPPQVDQRVPLGHLEVDLFAGVLTTEPLGEDQNGNPVFLKDIWPTSHEIQEFILKYVTRELYESKYADVFKGDANWQAVQVPAGQTYAWDDKSTYVQNPPYFVGLGKTGSGLSDIKGARVLGLFGDSITTDHISPAGNIKKVQQILCRLFLNALSRTNGNPISIHDRVPPQRQTKSILAWQRSIDF